MHQFNDRDVEIMLAALNQVGIVEQLAGNGFAKSDVAALEAKLRPIVVDMIKRDVEMTTSPDRQIDDF